MKVAIGVAAALAVGTISLCSSEVVAAAPPGDFEAELPSLELNSAPLAPQTEPAPDPVLADPLLPLATFQPTPSPVDEASSDPAPTPVPYRLELLGLDEVGLERRFRSLSSLLGDRRPAQSVAQVQARANEDVELVRRLLREQGYYDGAATADVAPAAVPGEPAAVRIAATPGDRYRLGSINVTGAAAEPEAMARRALDLEPGSPLVAPDILAAEANVSLRLPEQGYPFVDVGPRDVLLDEAVHTGDYSLQVDAGPRSTFGDVRVADDPVFTARHIETIRRFRSGQLYDSRLVDDLRQALVATSLYSSVSIEPVRTGTQTADRTEQVDLLVRQHKGPWRTLAATAGYGTGEGFKVTGLWTHRNFFPPEGALIIDAVAGTQEQTLSATFRRSNAGRRDRTVQASISAGRRTFEAYDANTLNLSGSISRTSTPIWQKLWTYSLGAEAQVSRENRADPASLRRTDSTYYIGALPLQLGYDASNSLLDPTRGFRLTGRLSPEAQQRAGGGFDAYARALVEGSAYHPISSSIVLAARARLGSILGAPRDAIAPSRRYYSGGGGSVRGFGFQDLGPRDAKGEALGGRSLTELAVEARYRFGDYGVVPFVDAGRVGAGSAPSLKGLRYGAGIGFRYYTNFGPLRVDVATPFGRKPGEPKVALYISIGQAF